MGKCTHINCGEGNESHSLLNPSSKIDMKKTIQRTDFRSQGCYKIQLKLKKFILQEKERERRRETDRDRETNRQTDIDRKLSLIHI